MSVVAIDYETEYNSEEGLGIKQQGAWKYVHDARFNPYLITVCDGKESWAGEPKNFNYAALDGQTLLSHNAAFERLIHSVLEEQGKIPKLNIPAWHCTANLTTFLCMRRDMKRAADFLLGEKVDKGVRDDKDKVTWEQMKAKGLDVAMIQYARGDGINCYSFWAKYGHLWPERERKLSDLTIRQGARGVQIDEQKLKLFLHTAQEMLIQAESRLPWMKEGKKPTSPKAIAEECRKHQIPCPPVKNPKHKSKDVPWGEEAYDEWAETYARFTWVKAYTDYRVINKFIGILETIQERLHDGIFSFDQLYFGAHTGRWAGSGGFNMQNMRKEPLFRNQEGWLITSTAQLREIELHHAEFGQYPPCVSLALDLRSLFIPRPGKKMIASDLSQIEPRVLSWLVKDEAELTAMAAGMSPYESHARATMGWTGGDLKKENKSLYALAKARRLGLGYGCGWKKFIKVAQDLAGLDITVDDPEEVQKQVDGVPCFDAENKPIMEDGFGFNSKRIVSEYRLANPLIAGKTGIWAKLEQSFRDSVGTDFVVELPSGRSLRYPQVMRERKKVVDLEEDVHGARPTYKWVYTALAFDQKRNAVVRKVFYGGLLTENVIQAISRDVFGEHCITMDETPGIDVLWTVHDEAIDEVEQSVSKGDVENIMSQTPEWLEGCPIAAEAKEIPHYKK